MSTIAYTRVEVVLEPKQKEVTNLSNTSLVEPLLPFLHQGAKRLRQVRERHDLSWKWG